MNEVMLIYHRHLECLFMSSSTKYIAISHVWHPDVAELQHKNEEAEVNVDNVALLICEVPVRIYLGLMPSIQGHFEVWHDYISVPQWQHELKKQILPEIPRIFHKASVTVAFLSDINDRTVKAMRAGNAVEERCRAVSNICNAKYFSRVWTAMEFTESREWRTMVNDYTLVDKHPVYRTLIQEVWDVWSTEHKNQTDPLALERMVEMGSNLVPWQLGPIDLIRDLHIAETRTPFGIAHELLSRRCITRRRDFFHVLLGTLKVGLTESQLSADEQEAMQQVAKRCIELGDYSPLLMIPASAQTDAEDILVQSCGYLDLTTFTLGGQQEPPTFADVRFCPLSGNLIMQAEGIGQVQRIKRVEWSRLSHFETASILVRLVLESTGPDVDQFVNALGGRLYGQVPDRIFDRLREGGRMGQLQTMLQSLHGSMFENRDEATRWIVDAMGLSNTTLGSPMSIGSPMEFLEAHGGTIHLGDHGAVVSVTCKRCNGEFLLRAALIKPDSVVEGATAYRIPGLKFEFGHAGGSGFLLQHDHQIVGRLLWAIPTCGCLKREEIEVNVPDLPLPRSNTFRYGEQSGWVPVNSTARIRTK